MSFIAKNPLIVPTAVGVPPTPPKGTVGIFPTKDGWKQIDDEGNITIMDSTAIDETPTENSSNAITSGGVYNALLKYIPHISTGIKDPNVPVWTTEDNTIVFKYWYDDGGGTGWYYDYFVSMANSAIRALQDEYGNTIVDTYANRSQFYVLDGDVAALKENCSREPTLVYLEAIDRTLFLDAYVCDNHIFQAYTLTSLDFGLYSGSFSPGYTCSINFTSGETPTEITYTKSGIINWVGTDCTLKDGMSIFSPVANKRYNIVIYFDGITFVGCVNGFTPATVNNSSVAEV